MKCNAIVLVALGYLFQINATAQTTNSFLFQPVPASFFNRTVVLPEGFSYKVLFSEGDTVVTNSDVKAPAKGSQDMVVYIPIKGSSKHGYLYVNHEEHKPNALLGDGGGGTVFEIKQDKGGWRVVDDFHAVDFAGVGQTFRNCGGTLTPQKTVLTTEEELPLSNTEIFSQFGITDTADYNGRKKFMNYGWITEVDPLTHKARTKLKVLGRMRHEDAQCMPDGKTIYLTADDKPSVLFKFVAARKRDYTKGQLYAYKQSADAASGIWIPLAMEYDSLADITNVALRLGATMFISTEWIEAVGDKLYITESGSNRFSFEEEIKMGGVPAKHLQQLCKKDSGYYEDPYGRLLELDLRSNKVRVLVNGGIAPGDSLFCFSSPDAMTSVKLHGKTYLVISEDTQGNKNGKASAEVAARNETYNEVYWLDLTVPDPALTNLQRFMMAPEGCETTGNMFTPDGKTYFVSIQHPSATNPAPFNRSCVIAVTGFK